MVLKNLNTNDPDELINADAIELVDPYEQEYIKTAMNVGELEKAVEAERRLRESGSRTLLPNRCPGRHLASFT